MTDTLRTDCRHEVIQSWRYEDGKPADFWSCADCKYKFVPITELMQAENELVAARAEVERLEREVETWKFLYCRAINEANGLTNYVEDRPELYSAEKRLTTIQEDARAALKETK